MQIDFLFFFEYISLSFLKNWVVYRYLVNMARQRKIYFKCYQSGSKILPIQIRNYKHMHKVRGSKKILENNINKFHDNINNLINWGYIKAVVILEAHQIASFLPRHMQQYNVVREKNWNIFIIKHETSSSLALNNDPSK